VRDAQALTVQTGKGEFLVVVLRAIVERHSKGYPLTVFIKHCGGVHTTGKYKKRVFHIIHNA
jgi:hypothetical protein